MKVKVLVDLHDKNYLQMLEWIHTVRMQTKKKGGLKKN